MCAVDIDALKKKERLKRHDSLQGKHLNSSKISNKRQARSLEKTRHPGALTMKTLTCKDQSNQAGTRRPKMDTDTPVGRP